MDPNISTSEMSISFLLNPTESTNEGASQVNESPNSRISFFPDLRSPSTYTSSIPTIETPIRKRSARKSSPQIENLKTLIEQVKNQPDADKITREEAIKCIFTLAQQQGRPAYTGNTSAIGLAQYLNIPQRTCNRYLLKEFGRECLRKNQLGKLKELIEQIKNQPDADKITREEAIKCIFALAQQQGMPPYTGIYNAKELAQYLNINKATCNTYLLKEFGRTYQINQLEKLKALIEEVKTQPNADNIDREEAIKRIFALAQKEGRPPYTGKTHARGLAQYLNINKATCQQYLQQAFGNAHPKAD